MTLLAVPKHIIKRSVEELSELMEGKHFVGQESSIPPMLGKRLSNHFKPNRLFSDLFSLPKAQWPALLKAFWSTLTPTVLPQNEDSENTPKGVLSAEGVTDHILAALEETRNLQQNQTNQTPLAIADSEFDHIPISQALVEYHHFKSTLENMIHYVSGLSKELSKLVQAKGIEHKGSKMMALGYESDIKNPKALHKAKLQNFENYIASTEQLISKINSPDLTTTHVLDFLDLIYEYGEINQELNRKINSPTTEGLFINFIDKSKKEVQNFLEKVITAHNTPSP